ncbi:uncharacterized protein Tco025E_10181 [Trypanosoma conorhini]|uniref:Uncharacterized protein n=1 Tax=Trypanosoma conorhini TaxID=83891 RepID=A0A422MRV4_9TRYP|nr:uncharacterized protein Tco025E_10181 [Trypanosoma conorhini]RNE95939.1 hypothetical protein Tco025E_10181 [Trypanosoma conorhini]
MFPPPFLFFSHLLPARFCCAGHLPLPVALLCVAFSPSTHLFFFLWPVAAAPKHNINRSTAKGGTVRLPAMRFWQSQTREVERRKAAGLPAVDEMRRFRMLVCCLFCSICTSLVYAFDLFTTQFVERFHLGVGDQAAISAVWGWCSATSRCRTASCSTTPAPFP